ncbi:MAG TPA: PaaI family thioesterase [bacterium]|nr:PaaI family thioesterase [bacterium]
MKVWQGKQPFAREQKASLMEKHRQVNAYFNLLALRLVDLEPGYCKLELPFRKEITHGGGVVQGGILTTLADSCIAHATMAALVDEAKYATTIELKINFIRPAHAVLFTAEAWLVHLGRRTAVGEAEIKDERGRLIAKCLSSLIVMAQQPSVPSRDASSP